MTKVDCASCRRSIDAAAKVCPYCGANPDTGDRIDTQAMLQEIFRPKEVSTSESVFEYARQRQGLVVGVSLFIAFLALAGLHQYVKMRNERAVANAQAVPLTEITDLANRKDETKPQTMPDIPFQYEGRPQVMRTFVLETGATLPPEIVAAQQAEAQAKAAEAAAKAAQQAPPPAAGAARQGVVVPGAVRPGVAPAAAARPAAVPARPPARP